MNEEAEVQRGLREFEEKKHKQMRWWLLCGLAFTVLCFFSCAALLPKPVKIIKVSVWYDPVLVPDAASAAALCESVKDSALRLNDYYRQSSGINTRLEITCPPFEGADSFYVQALTTTRLLTGAMFESEEE